jgi:hypothetical protein
LISFTYHFGIDFYSLVANFTVMDVLSLCMHFFPRVHDPCT